MMAMMEAATFLGRYDRVIDMVREFSPTYKTIFEKLNRSLMKGNMAGDKDSQYALFRADGTIKPYIYIYIYIYIY